MDDDFSANHLVQVSNEDIKTDSRLQIDIFSYLDLIKFNLFFIFTILTGVCISILSFFHYGVTDKTIYLNQNSNLIFIPSFKIIPFSGFYRIYFQAVQNQKKKEEMNLIINMKTIKQYLNNPNKTLIDEKIIYPTIHFNGKSDKSNSVTLVSSHDTSNCSINFELNLTQSNNFDKIIIHWELGSTSVVMLLFALKFFFFAISIIILTLIIWSHYYSSTYMWVKDFNISIIVWISFIFYSFFCFYQKKSFIYFMFSFLSTAIYETLTRFSIIYYITSITHNRTVNSNQFTNLFIKFGYVIYSIFACISAFIISISIFSYDQLNFELKGMKLDFLFNISFIVYIIIVFIQTKSVIEQHEKLNLIAFFSLPLIFFIEKVIVQYLLAFKNIYFCQQAGNNINYLSSSIFVFLILKYNWPIEDDIEIYYQPELSDDNFDLLE